MLNLTVQSLTESLWILTAVDVLAETGALSSLSQPVTLPELAKVTQLPSAVLLQTLN